MKIEEMDNKMFQYCLKEELIYCTKFENKMFRCYTFDLEKGPIYNKADLRMKIHKSYYKFYEYIINMNIENDIIYSNYFEYYNRAIKSLSDTEKKRIKNGEVISEQESEDFTSQFFQISAADYDFLDKCSNITDLEKEIYLKMMGINGVKQSFDDLKIEYKVGKRYLNFLLQKIKRIKLDYDNLNFYMQIKEKFDDNQQYIYEKMMGFGYNRSYSYLELSEELNIADNKVNNIYHYVKCEARKQANLEVNELDNIKDIKIEPASIKKIRLQEKLSLLRDEIIRCAPDKTISELSEEYNLPKKIVYNLLTTSKHQK